MSSTRSRRNGSTGVTLRSRLSASYKAAPKWLPPSNPHAAIPQAVLDQLAQSQLPPTKEAYDARLRELLTAHNNGGLK